MLFFISNKNHEIVSLSDEERMVLEVMCRRRKGGVLSWRHSSEPASRSQIASAFSQDHQRGRLRQSFLLASKFPFQPLDLLLGVPGLLCNLARRSTFPVIGPPASFAPNSQLLGVDATASTVLTQLRLVQTSRLDHCCQLVL